MKLSPALLVAALALAAPLAAQTPLPQPPEPTPTPGDPPPPVAGRPAPAAAAAEGEVVDACSVRSIERLGRNPTPGELRCRYRVRGPGKFGLLSYLDVPVYQPLTPLPGTHVVGVPGMPHPLPGESYERWEWRVLRTVYGPETRRVHRSLDLLDPVFMSKILRFERLLRERGISASRRETWRAPERQAWIFQQGRSRPGPFATTTLTSWHCRVDRLGRAAGRAADYSVPPSQLPRFHQAAAEVGLESYGADSNDPGHVYLPDTDAATGMELAVLRLVPRVPHVTLATGRPDGESVTPVEARRWKLLAQEFIANPFFPHPTLEPRAPAAKPPLRLAAAVPPRPAPAPPPPPTPRRRR